MLRLYLTRHGETEWNVQRRMQGWNDSPLTARGIGQARTLGRRLHGVPFAAIYSSSSPRALATAQILRAQNAAAPRPPLHRLPELREIHFGAWEGLVYEEVARQYPAEIERYRHTPQLYARDGAETFAQLRSRLLAGVEKILLDHSSGDLLLVTHGIALRMLLTHYLGRPMEEFWQPPTIYQTSLSLIEIEAGQASVKLHADTTHLAD